MSTRVSGLPSFRAFLPGIVSTATLITALLFVAVQPAPAQSRVIQKWIANVNGPTSASDVPAATVADSGGNVLVAGSVCLATDSTGFCTRIDLQIEKYNSSGQRLWGGSLASSGNDAEAANVAVDAAGDVYVAGWGANALQADGGPTYSTILIKYSASGARQWVEYYGYYQNTFFDSIKPVGLVVDAQGNAYLTSWGFNRSEDQQGFSYSTIATIKYSASGQRMWVKTYDHTDSGYVENQATGLAIDASADVYVIAGVGEGPHPLTLKYDTNGNLLWHQIADGYNAGWGISYSIVLDSAGNVYEGGLGQNGAETLYALKYDPDGHLSWMTRAPDICPGASNSDQVGRDVGVDSSGNVYLDGYADGFCQNALDLTKFDPVGNVVWQRVYDGQPGGFNFPKGMLVNAAGDVYIADEGGSVNLTPSNPNLEDFVTLKYDPSGNLLWTARYSGSTKTSSSAPVGIAGSGGNLYIAGASESNHQAGWATLDYV